MEFVNMFQQKYSRIMKGMGEKYEPRVRRYLGQVYMVLGATTAVAAVGALTQMKNIIDLGILAAITSVALVLGLHFYRDDGKNYHKRLVMLLSFGFCSGQTLGPLLSYIVHVNPAIIFTALVGTAITFASLTLAALFSQRGKYLYIGGVLLSVINTMALLSLFNLLFRSYFVQMAQLYIGVFVMAGFIVYDTQSIVEKCRIGNTDSVQHALDLFFDILSMFRRLLIILDVKHERKQKDERRKN